MLYTADGQVLLQQRDDKPTIPYPNTWTLFGGAVEPGEPPVDAVARELDEELELTLPLKLWFRFPCPVRSLPGKLVCMHYCYAGQLTVPLDALVLHEGQRFALFDAAEAAALPLAFDQQDVVGWFIERGLRNA